MPIIKLVSPARGDHVHFFRSNNNFIEGPYRVVEIGVTVQNIHTKKEFLWPLGLPCLVQPTSEMTIREIEIIDEREPEYKANYKCFCRFRNSDIGNGLIWVQQSLLTMTCL